MTHVIIATHRTRGTTHILGPYRSRADAQDGRTMLWDTATAGDGPDWSLELAPIETAAHFEKSEAPGRLPFDV